MNLHQPPIHRRLFLSMAAGALAAQALPSAPRIKAIAFDGFTIFDPRPIGALAEELFPGKGIALSDAWRTRQFEYTWLRTLTGSYKDFWHVTEEALVFATKLLKLELTAERRDRLMQAYLQLKAWPDAAAVLRELKASGLNLVFLSNFTKAMLEAGVQSAGLQGIFEPHLSTDLARAFKPDPRSYQLAVDALKLKREEIAFAAFGGWDAAGAKSFGYPTFWVNRMNLPVEELSVAPDAIGPDLTGLTKFVAHSA